MAEAPGLLPAATMANLRATTTATLTTQLFRRGFRKAFMQDVRPLASYGTALIGPAFTLRYIPAREDVDSYGVQPDPNRLQREAIDNVPKGHVIVMDCRRDARAASAGDVYVTRLKVRGAAGMVSDGGIRDSGTVVRMDLPVFCAGPSAPSNRILHRAVDYDVPIGCGGSGRQGPVPGSIQNTPEAVGKLVRRLAERHGVVGSAFEAGPRNYGVHRTFGGPGVICRVMVPSCILKRPGERIKSDTRDAATLACFLQAGGIGVV